MRTHETRRRRRGETLSSAASISKLGPTATSGNTAGAGDNLSLHSYYTARVTKVNHTIEDRIN